MRSSLPSVVLLISAFSWLAQPPSAAAAPGCFPPLPLPTLYADGDSATGDQVALAWDPIPGAIVQQIFADGQQIDSVSGDASYYLDTSATACVARTYYVRTLHHPCGTLDSAPVTLTPVALANTHLTGDFDGDGKTDPSVFDKSNGLWTWHDQNAPTPPSVVFGSPGDRPAPADYDGDGITDLAVYKAGTATWWLQLSCGGGLRFAYWGLPTDWLVPGDFDGDGKADVTVYRPSTGEWWTQWADGSNSLVTSAAGSIPVPGDYDADGKIDYAVYDPDTYDWHLRYSGGGSLIHNFGMEGWDPAPGQYIERGRTEIAIESANGLLISQRSSGDNGLPPIVSIPSTVSQGVTVSSDYDGDGLADLVIYDAGVWLHADGSMVINQTLGDNTTQAVPLLRLGTPP